MSALSLLAAAGPCLTLLQAAPAGRTSRAEVEELFRTRCMACHVAPDPRFAVERAWIAQVADTA